MRSRFASILIGILPMWAGCTPDPGVPDLDALRQPTGMAVTPGGRWLVVTNGNWDRGDDSGTVVALDLERLAESVAAPGNAGTELDFGSPCRLVEGEIRAECDDASLIREDATVRIRSGAGNVGLHRPKGVDGPLRLLVPTRIDGPSVAFVDMTGFDDEGGLEMECGQGGDRLCDDLHHVPVDVDPAQIMVDDEFPFAYLPHLLGERITLLALDGARGPEVTDVEDDFFMEDGLHETGLGGGFAVAKRACDLDTGNVPDNSRDCTRPFLYATHRFWWGVRTFRVAPGLELILGGSNFTVLGTNIESAEPKPLMGELEFEDPATGERLLVVHTTPPGLSRIDTSLNESDDPRSDLMQSVAVCQNPNQLAVHRPQDGDWLAFIACYGTHELAVVSLSTFTTVANLELGEGTNELVVDADRRWLYVANTIENTISVIELDHTRPDFLREVATVGLGATR